MACTLSDNLADTEWLLNKELNRRRWEYDDYIRKRKIKTQRLLTPEIGDEKTIHFTGT